MTIDVQTECRYRKLTVLSQHNIFIGFIHHHCKAIYGDRYDMAVPKIKLLHGHILCILAAIIRVYSIWRNHIQIALCSASMHFLVILDCPKSAHRNRSRNHGPSTCDLISHERNATQKTDKLYACSRAEPTNTDCWIDILHRAMAVRVRAFCFDRTHSNIDWF